QATLQLRLAENAAATKALLETRINRRGKLEYTSVHDPVQLLTIDGFETMLARFTTDIPYLSNWGKPLLIGPGSILVAHTAGERVAKSELLKAVEIYADLARRLLK